MRKPYLKLRRLLEDKGFSQKEFSTQVGIPYITLNNRLNADTCKWRPEEIVGICKALHIPQEQIGEYFFPEVEKGDSL